MNSLHSFIVITIAKRDFESRVVTSDPVTLTSTKEKETTTLTDSDDDMSRNNINYSCFV